VMVALVVLDALPGPRVWRTRLLPAGWLTGLATAVKLTPAVVAVADFFAGRCRRAWVAFGTFVVATAIGWLALPQASIQYWLGLLHGDTGTNFSLQYYTNQSIVGAWTRIAGVAPPAALAASAVVVVIGIVAAVGLHRLGQPALAVCLAGVASLVGSPIAWSHHYVWVVPLALTLVAATALPAWFRWFGLAYCAWVALAPWRLLPRAGGVEFSYTWWQHALDDLGVAAGVALLVLGVLVARGTFARTGSLVD